jgi:hypothetical protein
MATYSQRYTSGEHEEVWNDLRALGPVPDHLREDVADVSAQTMRRVSGHLRRLAEDAPARGLVTCHESTLTPATPDERAKLAHMERETGGLPAALVACVTEIGSFSLIGDWPEIGVHYETRADPESGPGPKSLPDPLDLPDVDLLYPMWENGWEDQAEDRADGYPFHVTFAPDEIHKANYSGGTHDIEIPDRRADPVLLGVYGRPGVTLVEYLRASVAWGGFPGWEFAEVPVPDTLRALFRDPDF